VPPAAREAVEPADKAPAPRAAAPAAGQRPREQATTRTETTKPETTRGAAAAKPKATTPAPSTAAATPARATDGNGAARQPVPSAEPVAVTAPTTNTAADDRPGQAPVSVATATHNPRERCGGRHLLAMHRCLVRECEKPEYTAHRECQKVRDIEARARAIHDSN
jgi:hypothetical protein